MRLVAQFLLLPVLGLSMLLAGCVGPAHLFDESVRLTRDIGLIDNHSVSRPHNFVLPADRSIYIAESLPAAHGQSVSGLAVQTSRAISEFFALVDAGAEAETFRAALRSARKRDADYLLYPQTVVWDDDVSGWSDLVAWLRRRDPAIQGFAPESAEGTSAIRAQQLKAKAKKQAGLNREQYFEWRYRNAASASETAEIQALQAQEKRRGLKSRLVGGTRNAMQWVHERANASVNWVGSRDLAALGRDQVGVRLVLVESRTGEIVETVILRGQSGVLTFLGDQPDELVDGPMQAYARSLSGRSDPESYAFQRFPF